MNQTTSELFSSISKEKKVDFFVKCQSLLIDNHPNSEFLVREDNLETRLKHAKELADKYKGYCYSNDNICLLFNLIYIENPDEIIKILNDNVYQPPKDKYNAISIDFVVFRDLKDCAIFCREHYDPNIEHILFVKNNKPKLYQTKKFVSSILGIPIV